MSQEKILGKNFGINDISKTKLVLSDDGKINHETYHHEEIMDQLIKTIEFTNMDKKMRSVLLLRLIHGYTIQRMQIYLFMHGHLTGNSHDELTAIEQEGKRLVMETLKKHTIQEIVSSINAKPSIITGLRNEFATPKPLIGLQ